MHALVIGKEDSLQRVIADELNNHDYEVVQSDNRARLPTRDFALCVDLSAGSISDVKRIAVSLRKRIAHYILLSTCRVYPSTPQLVPWQVEKIDLSDETGYGTVDREIRGCRAAERELKHIGSGGMPWSILRPAIVESKKNPDENKMWWFVSRILDGSPIVLPDDDDPLFRHVAEEDLAQAIRVIAGRKEAYFQTMHVTSPTLLSFESYARLLMERLGKKVPIVRVPGVRWRAAGLALPMGKHLASSFIADSHLLEQMGWRPMEQREWVREHVECLMDSPPAAPAARKAELALLELSAHDSPEAIPPSEPDNWRLVGNAGKLSSFRLEFFSGQKETSDPLFQTRKLSMGLAEERFLLEPATDSSSRIMGHTALLELIEPGGTDMQPGSLYLPVAQRPCGDAACIFCAGHLSGLFGINDDGFGAKYVSLPWQHLVPVPAALMGVALLADPLACLLAVLPSLLVENTGPVWIFGERVDALLAILLVLDTNRPLLHVGRTKIHSDRLPANLQSMPLQSAEKKTRDKSLEQPAMVINLSGSQDGENLLVSALAEGGSLITPFTATKMLRRRIDIHLSSAAPGRLWLERAIEQLTAWSPSHDLHSFLQPIPLAHYPDLFIAGQFRQPCIDLPGVG